MGPLEQEIYRMTRPDPPRAGGSAAVNARFAIVMRRLDKIERALLLLAAEIDGQQSASRPP